MGRETPQLVYLALLRLQPRAWSSRTLRYRCRHCGPVQRRGVFVRIRSAAAAISWRGAARRAQWCLGLVKRATLTLAKGESSTPHTIHTTTRPIHAAISCMLYWLVDGTVPEMAFWGINQGNVFYLFKGV